MNYHDQIREDAKQANELLLILNADDDVSVDCRPRGLLKWKTSNRGNITFYPSDEFRFTPKPTTRPMNHEEWEEYVLTCGFVRPKCKKTSLLGIERMLFDQIRVDAKYYNFFEVPEYFEKPNGDPLTVTE